MNVTFNKAMAPALKRWQTLQQRQQRLAMAVGLVVVAGLLIAFVWLPLERSQADLLKRLPDLRAQLAAMQQDAEAVKRLRVLPVSLNAPQPRALDATQLRAAFPGAQVTALDGNRFKIMVSDTRYAEWLDALRGLGSGIAVDEATLVSISSGRVSVDAVVSIRKT